MLIPTVKPAVSVNDLLFSSKPDLKKYFRQEYVLTGSGSAAIYLAIKASGAKKVQIPAFTCSIVADTVRKAGIRPLFYDASIVVTLTDVKVALRQKPDLIILAYNFGLVPDELDKILAECKRQKVQVLEDCAHAFGFGQNADFTIYSAGIAKSISHYGGFLVSARKHSYELLPKINLLTELKFLIQSGLSQIVFNRYLYRFYAPLVNQYIDKYPQAKLYLISDFAKRVVLNQIRRFDELQTTRQINFELAKNLKSVVKTKTRSDLYLVLQSKHRDMISQYLRSKGVEILPTRSFHNLGGQLFKKAAKAEKEHLAFSLYRPKRDMEVVIDAIKTIERRL